MNTSARREYRSELRSQQADQTRARVAQAAAGLFVRDGYAATSINAVARAAGVSAQTVYNIFGTKAAVLKAAYDIALVGDADPVPLAERADVRALYADPDPVRFLRGYARLGPDSPRPGRRADAPGDGRSRRRARRTWSR